MFITIDGHSGAGKSTQADILAKRLKLNFTNFNNTYRAYDVISFAFGQPGPCKQLFASVCAWHTIQPPHDNIIFDNFWDSLYQTYLHDELTLSSLNMFRDALKLNNRSEPSLSIILNTPYHMALARQISRDKKIHLKLNREDSPDDKRRLEFWQFLESEIHYLHVINGNQSITNVTESIIKLLPK